MIPLLLAQAVFVGNAACAPCHAGIVAAYEATPMAQSSGRVASLPEGTFRHRASGVRYEVESEGTIRWAGRGNSGHRRVDYFIGSSAAGRSYLTVRDGFLYQAPITWYAQAGRWDVSPGYENDRGARWTRAIEPNCLYCHASQPQPIYGTQNRYAEPPFRQNGVGCERCHGPGSEHAAGRGRMVNPARLPAASRDAVCQQCHLSGEARIERPGKLLAQYRPGEELTEYVDYFVLEGGQSAGLKATSHVEKLDASRCRTASFDRLWCGTCHDPHRVPAESEKAGWFRGKCLSCHRQTECERGPDCISCHMPRTRVVDGGHGVLTDHSIPRNQRSASGTVTEPAGGRTGWRLVPYPGSEATPRGLGLAYAEVSLRRDDRRQQEEALRLLSGVPADRDVLVRLADLHSRAGAAGRAESLYEKALQANPHSVVALVNLGSFAGNRGDYPRAIALWRKALEKNPLLPEALKNLVPALEAVGDSTGAERVRRLLAEWHGRE